MITNRCDYTRWIGRSNNPNVVYNGKCNKKVWHVSRTTSPTLAGEGLNSFERDLEAHWTYHISAVEQFVSFIPK